MNPPPQKKTRHKSMIPYSVYQLVGMIISDTLFYAESYNQMIGSQLKITKVLVIVSSSEANCNVIQILKCEDSQY